MAPPARPTGVHMVKIGLRSAALAIVFAGLFAGPVAADCQPVDSVQAALESAEVAFVGTAVGVSEARSSATFRVEETWVGTVGPTVEVFGLNGGRGISEDDRVWQGGQRYLVIPYVIEGHLADHLCSGTTPWSNELEALRPAGTTAAEPAPATSSLPGPLVLVAAVLAGLAATAWLAFRSREHPRGLR